MSKKLNAEVLQDAARLLREQVPNVADTLESVASQLQYESKKDDDWTKLQEIGKHCAESLAEMVAALECDYDRLEELDTPENNADIAALRETDEATELVELREAAGDCESREDAERRIQEDPLSIELSGTWQPGETPTADRALILLGTGGPATRIVCELDHHNEPSRAWIEAQDWFQPWTEYLGDAISSDDLLTYCRCFYFGEG